MQKIQSSVFLSKSRLINSQLSIQLAIKRSCHYLATSSPADRTLRRLRCDRERALIRRECRDTRMTCTIVPTVLDYGGGKTILLAYAHVRRQVHPTSPRPLRRSFSSFHARQSITHAFLSRVVAARRRTRIIHVRATTEFVGHAVDRGESRTRGLNVIGRWLQTMLLECCSAKARPISRVAKLRVPTYIYALCRYDYRDYAAISLHYICITQ